MLLTKNIFYFLYFRCKFSINIYKKILNVWAMELLFTITFLSTNKEFWNILASDFSVTTDERRFLNIFWISLKIILIWLFFRFFYFRHYNGSNYFVVVALGERNCRVCFLKTRYEKSVEFSHKWLNGFADARSLFKW